MAALKSAPTRASAQAFLRGIGDENRRRDCQTIARLMREATQATPRMWGPSIVGFGTSHYRYASGREGDWFLSQARIAGGAGDRHAQEVRAQAPQGPARARRVRAREDADGAAEGAGEGSDGRHRRWLGFSTSLGLADEFDQGVPGHLQSLDRGLFGVRSVLVGLEHRTVVLEIIDDLGGHAIEFEGESGVLAEHLRDTVHHRVLGHAAEPGLVIEKGQALQPTAAQSLWISAVRDEDASGTGLALRVCRHASAGRAVRGSERIPIWMPPTGTRESG